MIKGEGKDRVLWRAIEVFGNHDSAMIWLRTPCMALDGVAPAFLTGTSSEVDLVLEILEIIEASVAE